MGFMMNYIEFLAPMFCRKKLALALVIVSSILAPGAPARAFPVEFVGKRPESILLVTSCVPSIGDLKAVQEKTFNKLGARLSGSELRRFLPFADSNQLLIPISYADFGSIHYAGGKETIVGRLAQNRDGTFCPVYIVMRGAAPATNKIQPLSGADLADPVVQNAILKMTINGVRTCKYWYKVNVEELQRGSYAPFGETQLRFCDLSGRFGDDVFPEAVRMGITLARLSTDTESYVFMADYNMAIFIEIGGR